MEIRTNETEIPKGKVVCEKCGYKSDISEDILGHILCGWCAEGHFELRRLVKQEVM